MRQPANELVMDKINIGDTILIVRMDDDGGKDLQAKAMTEGRESLNPSTPLDRSTGHGADFQ